MDGSDTKSDIIRAMCTAAQDLPFEKITVGTVTDIAGTSRQTFYYHFNSMFEAYTWTIGTYTKRQRTVESANGSKLSILEYAHTWASALERQRTLTISILKSPYANEFREFYNRKNYEITLGYVKKTLGDVMPADIQNITALFVSHAFTEIVIDWIRKSMDIPLSDVLDNINELLEITMKPEIYQKLSRN